ncbi:MAG: stage III sporulation protein AF [Lachnospiraceae bacterium]|nr:stage III sporulation protein AF [Lachnospiraceae bacterium]
MTQWMKTLAGSMCVLTILLHLVPDGRFAKYVRFYAGLVFFLVAINPALELLGDENQLEQLLALEFLKEEYYDLETAAEGLSDLKNEQILEAYQAELERQVAEIASAYGLMAVSTEITFGGDGYSIETISIIAENSSGEGDEAALEKTKTELAGLYLLPESEITLAWGE